MKGFYTARNQLQKEAGRNTLPDIILHGYTKHLGSKFITHQGHRKVGATAPPIFKRWGESPSNME